MKEIVQLCSVCGKKNDVIRHSCYACGAVLRDRVAVLNLFETAVKLLENPSAAMLRIVRSDQRNYTMLMFAALGPLLMTIVLYASSAGDVGIHFGLIVLSYFAMAPVFGIIGNVASGALTYLLLPLAGEKRKLKLHLSIQAWSLVPLVLSSLIILVIGLSVFGNTLFSQQLPAYVYKPMVFWVLTIVVVLFGIWSLVLLFIGLSSLGMNRIKALFHVVIFYAFHSLVLFALSLLFNSIFNSSVNPNFQ
jgi:Yip1-like protein